MYDSKNDIKLQKTIKQIIAMKVTVCELSDSSSQFSSDWEELKAHLAIEQPVLLLLPEMPFYRWLAADQKISEESKKECIAAHQKWLKEIERLDANYIVYSSPELIGGKFLNTAFVYSRETGHQRLHSKAYFPEEPHFWEASWFDREEPVSFKPFELEGFKIGVLLCTELWFTQHAREYGMQGVDLLLCPRATGKESVNTWLNCGKTSAVISGAYCLSSNRSGSGEKGFEWGGMGWITEPMDGALLASSSFTDKFVTKNIDLEKARQAKKEYPLYVVSNF